MSRAAYELPRRRKSKLQSVRESGSQLYMQVVDESCLPFPFEIWVLVHEYVSPFDLGRLMCASCGCRSIVHNSVAHTELNFSEERYRVNDNSMIACISAFKCGASHIKRINLKHCFNITDRSMHTIATACTSLRSVHLDGTEGFPLHNVTDKAIASLAEHCGHLEELSVRQSGVTTFGIQILSERAPNAHALKWRKLHFKSIDLWGSRVDNTVVEWLSQFEGLENLGVGKCPSFTSEGLSKLFKAMPSPKKIRNIDLSFSRIKAPALTTLSQIFGKTLEKLDLSGNRLSEAGICFSGEDPLSFSGEDPFSNHQRC